jgi:hypothetical protein
MLASLRSLNLLLMFVLELAVYAAACRWGFTTVGGWPGRVALGLGAPVVLAVVWALFGAPRAARPARGAGRVLLEVLWFGCGAAALAAAGWTGWAAAFAALFVLNAALRVAWGQQPQQPET